MIYHAVFLWIIKACSLKTSYVCWEFMTVQQFVWEFLWGKYIYKIQKTRVEKPKTMKSFLNFFWSQLIRNSSQTFFNQVWKKNLVLLPIAICNIIYVKEFSEELKRKWGKIYLLHKEKHKKCNYVEIIMSGKIIQKSI